MTELFNETDVRKTYQFLRHQKETEIRVIDPHRNKSPISIFVNNEDDFVKKCREYNGEYNIYVGINERKSKGTTKSEVISVRSIVLDIDPKRENASNNPSTPEELELARLKARQIQDDFTKFNFKRQHVVCSGNGYQIWCAIPPIEITDTNRDMIEEKLERFQDKFRKKYSDDTVKIDQLGDLPRIIKVIGTKSIKGRDTKERPHRLSHTVDNLIPEEDRSLLDEILAIPVSNEKKEAVVVEELTPKTKQELAQIARKDPLLQKYFAGDFADKISRSEAEMSVICRLINNQIPKNQCFEIMQSCKIGKWQTAGQQYREHTYKNALEYVRENAQIKVDPVLWVNKDDFEWNPLNYFKDERFLSSKFAEDLIAHSGEIFLSIRDSDDIYYYDKGIYSLGGDERIKDRIRNFFASTVTAHGVREVIAHVQARTRVNKNVLNKDVEVLCLRNGVYNMRKRVFLPHDSKLLLTRQIPVTYDPTASCPAFMKFVSEVLAPEDVGILQEAFGYALWGENHIRAAFMFKGAGGNGKSIALHVLTCLLGRDNVSNVPLADLDQNRFAMARLINKMANIFSDLPRKALLDVGKFKALTGGDPLEGEMKGVQEWKQLGVAPKQFYSTNELPQVTDTSSAFWDRWIVLDFPNSFPAGVRDVDLKTKLVTDAELSGVLKWSLDGLSRLLVTNKFSFSKTRDEVMQQWINETDPVQSFINNCLSHESTYSIPVEKQLLYETQVEFCRANGYEHFSETAFFKLLYSKLTWRITEDKPRTFDGRFRRIFGLKFKGKGIDYYNSIHTVLRSGSTFTPEIVIKDTSSKGSLRFGVYEKSRTGKNASDLLPSGNYLMIIIAEMLKTKAKPEFSHQDVYSFCDLEKVSKAEIDEWIEYKRERGDYHEIRPGWFIILVE